MTDTTRRPVVFLAFANDRDDTVGYLRNLPDEARRLRDVLEPAEQRGLCEVIVYSNCTAGDIFKVFQDPRYRNRIAIFHYGGHANGYQLLLETTRGQAAGADASGLATFLGQQLGLQLVFLNGCSTQQQSQGLLDANISAVIATSRAIDDQVATDFAYQFYQGLAGGNSVSRSYNEAAGTIQTVSGSNTRGLYFGNQEDAKSQPEADRWPWNLYLREGSEAAGQWNLPEAVNDPLFGLPPLPEQDLPETPYRHLHWFTRKDAEVFFGRGRQIRELYERLTAPRSAPIILFYGQSGVGKSSILDAGLIPRLEGDYEVRYLRRREGGLLDTLQLAFLPEASDLPIESAWRVKEERLQKPLIVFLDQVEELYTRPLATQPDELADFLKAVRTMFCEPSLRPQGKLVLGFRKEWLAELEAQLAAYELPRTKVFLEPLDRRGIIEVVQGPTKSQRLRERYGLRVEDGLADMIADRLLSDHDSAIAPTLQILLTKMWARATAENYECPQFKQALYRQLERDGIALRDFLTQQIVTIGQRNPTAMDSGLLLDILAFHTTPRGTANQHCVAELGRQYSHLGDTLPPLLQQSQDLHLLTVAANSPQESENATRLAHDTLAPIVREQFDHSDRPGQRARRILDNRLVDWAGEKTGVPLDEADLKVVEQGVSGTRALNSTEQRLVKASRDLRTESQRTRTVLIGLGAIAVALIAGLGSFGMWNYTLLQKTNTDLVAKSQEANRERDNALRRESELLSERAMKLIEDGKVTEGISLALQALPTSFEPPNRPLVASAEFALNCGLWRAREKKILSVKSVSDVSITQDGEYLLTLSDWGDLRLWDVTRGTHIRQLAAPQNSVGDGESVFNFCAFDRAGRRVIGTSYDHTATIWNVASGEGVRLIGHKGPVTCASFSPNGEHVVTASEDSIIRVWDAETGIGKGILEGHAAGVMSVEFNSDGDRLVSASRDGTACVWDIVGLNRLRIVNNGQPVRTATFTPNGNEVLTVSEFVSPLASEIRTTALTNAAAVWDTETGSRIAELKGHSHQIYDMKVSTDGKTALSVAEDGTARLWRIPTGVLEQTVSVLPSEAYTTRNGLTAGFFLTQRPAFVTASQDGTVRLWIFGQRQPVATIASHSKGIRSASCTADGKLLATASFDDTVRIWETRDLTDESAQLGFDRPEQLLATNDEFFIPRRDSDSYSPSQENGRFLTTSFGEVTLSDTVTKKQIGVLAGHTATISIAKFSPDGKYLVTMCGKVEQNAEFEPRGQDHTVRVWDAHNGQLIVVLKGHTANVEHAAFSVDSQFLVTGSFDSTARIWSLPDGEAVKVFYGHRGPINCVDFSHNGERILTGSADRTARLWDVDSCKLIAIAHHSDTVESAEFSRDGRYFVTSSLDGEAKIWEGNTGKLHVTLTTSSPRLNFASFTHDQRRVVTAAVDPGKYDGDGAFGSWMNEKEAGRMVRFWDVETGELVNELPHAEPIVWLALSATDSRVASLSDVMRIWDVPSDTLQSIARARSRLPPRLKP